MSRKVIVVLTPKEAELLDHVVGNGWGDGAYRDWLHGKRDEKILLRAMTKLTAARKAARIKKAKKKAKKEGNDAACE